MSAPAIHSPMKVTIEITNTCNLDCIHCYKNCTRNRSPHELSTEDWKRFVDELVENGFINAFIEGGEPLFRSDFIEILEYMCPNLLTWVRTNGTLVNREAAESLKAAGVGWVCVDLLGADAQTHESLTGTPGSFELSCRGIRNLVEVGLPVIALLVLTKRSVGRLQRFVDLAHELGARKIGILRLYPLGKAKRRWKELCPGLDEAMEALSKLEALPGLSLGPKNQSWHPNDGNCCWQNAAVSYFGRSVGCPYLREFADYGNIRDRPFLETWNHPLYRQLRSGQVEGGCGDCASNTLSSGGCRATAYAFTGRWDAPDPYCVNTRGEVDVRELPEWLLQEDGEPAKPAR